MVTEKQLPWTPPFTLTPFFPPSVRSSWRLLLLTSFFPLSPSLPHFYRKEKTTAMFAREERRGAQEGRKRFGIELRIQRRSRVRDLNEWKIADEMSCTLLRISVNKENMYRVQKKNRKKSNAWFVKNHWYIQKGWGHSKKGNQQNHFNIVKLVLLNNYYSSIGALIKDDLCCVYVSVNFYTLNCFAWINCHMIDSINISLQ